MKNKLKASIDVVINVAASKVWEALTKPEIIKQYFFGTNTITEWKVGGPIKFTGEYQGTTYEDRGTILAFKPEKLIEYKYWSSMSGTEDIPENYLTITYELKEENNKTTLTVTQDNIVDEKTKEHSENNWKMVFAGLKNLLESGAEVAPY